ncbi:MAG: peptidoglycan recognition family protein [Bryobacteraceae bacterium]
MEWRAQQIEDPVARLRYLRQATGADRVPTSPSRPMRRFSRRWAPAFGLAGFIVAMVLLVPSNNPNLVAAHGAHRNLPLPAAAPEPGAVESVWLVEQKGGVEVYSNGLRIETASAIANETRFDRETKVAGRTVVAGSVRPRGIVFHTTESLIAPFEATQNQNLQRVAHWLLDYLRENRSYHYLIDRFGRVHRVVREEDSAWHAGNSIWADSGHIYVNLNHSFLAVAFESATQKGDRVSESVTPAQVHAAKILTGMLRDKYKIAAVDCVTHAQVSVNQERFLVGLHTDWAANFPFRELGLPDNYEHPLAAIYAFGFGYDDDFVASTGTRVWKGLAASDNQMRQEATAQGLSVTRYRAMLQERYRSAMATLTQGSARGGQSTEQLAKPATRNAPGKAPQGGQ